MALLLTSILFLRGAANIVSTGAIVPGVRSHEHEKSNDNDRPDRRTFAAPVTGNLRGDQCWPDDEGKTMNGLAPSTRVNSIRRRLVNLRMHRALKILEATRLRIEQGRTDGIGGDRRPAGRGVFAA